MVMINKFLYHSSIHMDFEGTRLKKHGNNIILFESACAIQKAHTSNMLLIGEVKGIHFLFKRVQNLSMSSHVCCQYQSDSSLWKNQSF